MSKLLGVLIGLGALTAAGAFALAILNAQRQAYAATAFDLLVMLTNLLLSTVSLKLAQISKTMTETNRIIAQTQIAHALTEANLAKTAAHFAALRTALDQCLGRDPPARGINDRRLH